MSARVILERADWAGAALLPVKPSQYPAADSLTRFARGLGMARSGDLGGAKAEIDAIKTLRATLEKANQSYWANRSEEQVLTISAWIALKEGARDQAIKFMRAAADGEDGSIKSVAMENRLYPLRELLGELLNDESTQRRIADLMAGAEPAPTLESNSMIVLFAHVRTGKWASIMPAKLAETLGLTESVRAIPIVDPAVTHAVGLIGHDA